MGSADTLVRQVIERDMIFHNVVLLKYLVLSLAHYLTDTEALCV